MNVEGVPGNRHPFRKVNPTMNATSLTKSCGRWVAAGIGLAGASYAAYAGLTWSGYGLVHAPTAEEADPLLDRFMPNYEIAERHHLHKPITEQPIYNLFERHRFSREYERVYKDYGYGTTTFSPLASGLLSGKYGKGIPKASRAALEGYDWLHEHVTDKEKLAKVKALQSIADELGCTLSQLALAWCLKNPYVSTVITGASRVEQVHENMKASEVAPKLTPEIMGRIDTSFGTNQEEEEA